VWNMQRVHSQEIEMKPAELRLTCAALLEDLPHLNDMYDAMQIYVVCPRDEGRVREWVGLVKSESIGPPEDNHQPIRMRREYSIHFELFRPRIRG